VIEYADLSCPACAVSHARASLRERRVFRHFPLATRRPRARPLAHASEAAAVQGRFWDFVDSVYADHGRLDDPHLWERCRELGIDLDRFEADRRSEAVAERVDRDFRSGIRAGVIETPTFFRS
jgi:protein-disulfide isomerase